ncbi:MAG: hypothetical protein MJE66_11700 [Proteobacteria bacterium]|nr:hypothetical protein [Pseudomonadota bacterium]
MTLFDSGVLDALDAKAFQTADPYPWLNIEAALGDAAYGELRETLPPLELFERRFGESRKFGQQPHDRYALEYHPDLPLEAPWRRFMAELEGPSYRAFLRRMLGTPWFDLAYHWHYTPRGCAVSPHCDAKRKLGSHIFYFNTRDDWDPSWGGDTLVLDDGGRFDRRSSPDFDDFDRVLSSDSLGNRSLLFRRRGNSWHGVREIQCPDDQLRKVFIVVIQRAGPLATARRWIAGRPAAA